MSIHLPIYSNPPLSLVLSQKEKQTLYINAHKWSLENGTGEAISRSSNRDSRHEVLFSLIPGVGRYCSCFYLFAIRKLIFSSVLSKVKCSLHGHRKAGILQIQRAMFETECWCVVQLILVYSSVCLSFFLDYYLGICLSLTVHHLIPHTLLCQRCGLLNEFRHSRYYTPLNMCIKIVYGQVFIDSTLIKSTYYASGTVVSILQSLLINIKNSRNRLQLRQHRSF